MAGTGASERQLTGIIKLDDVFQAASSSDRLSSLDPMRLFDMNITNDAFGMKSTR